MRLLIAFIVCASIALASCKKHRFSDNNNLLGKWRMTETSHAGSLWVKVIDAEQHSYEFGSDSTYTYTPPLISSSTPCSGTYKTSRDTLIINWDCGPGPSYKMESLYLVSSDVLILEYYSSATGYKVKYVRK